MPLPDDRRSARLTVWLPVIAIATAAACGESAPPVTGTHAFVNATVLPMTSETLVPGQTVVVQSGRIVAMGPNLQLADGVERIDATGKYLMPGLAEMHGHYPQDAEGQGTRDILFLYVANGVTRVRGMQGGPQHLPLKAAIERRDVLGPALWVSAPMLHGRTVTSADQAAALVREAKAAGFDHLKVHEELSPAVYDAIASTAKEVGITFSGHVSNYVGLEAALAKGQRTIDHLDNYLEALVENRAAVEKLDLFGLGRLANQIDESRLDAIVRATVDAGAGVVPTMALWEVLFGSRSGEQWKALRPEIAYMPGETVSRWVADTDQRVQQFGSDPAAIASILALRRRTLKALNDAGVPILLGTDSPQVFSVPGFSIHHEMALMVASGMTPYEVLHAGTRAVAEFYGQTDDFGTVAAGQRADLVLLNANPLENVAHVADTAGVMVNGQWIARAAIDERLAEIRSRTQ